MKSIDNQDELFVVVDKDDKVVGYKTRGECHKDRTIIHRSALVVLCNKDGEILLQKRSLKKDLYPGYFTLSSSGHVAKDESYEDAIKREIKEELGVVSPVEFVTKFIVYFATETEMMAIFKGDYDGSFTINKDEIDFVKFYTKIEINMGIKNKKMKFTPCSIQTFKYLGIIN